MAKDKEPETQTPPASTNALLAQILQVAQDSNTTLKASLAVQKSTGDALMGLAPAFAALLKVESDSRDLLKQISDALGGSGGSNQFTARIIQLAKQLKKEMGG